LNWDNSELFAVLAISGLGALWKAASLRGDLGKDWTPRIRTAEAGLAERATAEALAMQQEISNLIGSGAGQIPRLATVDPSPLAERAGDLQKTLRVGVRVPNDFKWFMRLGPLMIGAAVVFLIGLAAAFLDSSELLKSTVLRTGGVLLGGTAGVFGLLLITAYVLLNQRLSGAEIRSQETPS
jgi:hypothetical protein